MVNLMKKALTLCIASAVVLVAPAVVPEAAAQGLAPDYYGTADANYHYVSAEEFQSNNSDGYLQNQHGFWRCASLSGLNVVAPLRLPSGALVDGYTVIFDDSSADGNISVWLSRYWVSALGTAGTTRIGPTFASSGDPGITSSWVELDPDLTISYFNATFSTQSYVLTAAIECRDDLSFRGVIVRGNRQVSPAPALATFNDVPTGHWAFQFIEALADSGITAGCGGGSFCPDNTLTRAEMAVFLSKALGLHYSP
jgi:hypothetical protein